MKKILFVFFAFMLVKANAQSADDVIKNYANAMGGLDKFNAIKTLKMSGNVSVQGMDLPITIQIINAKALRVDVDAMGQSITNVYYNGKGWKVNPLMGITTATDATADEITEFKNQSYVTPQLMDYKARGYKVELDGEADVEGVKTTKLKLTTENNKVTTYFIDQKTNMLVKTVDTRNIPGQGDVEVETYFSDIKDINGLKFAASRVQKMQGETFQEIHFDKVDIDQPIDEKIFSK